MDTLGALALGTESPSASVLERKPYKRSASLISRPMWRNILCQSAFQLTLLFVLLFKGAELFGVRKLSEKNCFTYYVENGTQKWDSATLLKSSTGDLSCSSFLDYCPKKDDTCYNNIHQSAIGYNFQFQKLPDFSTECLTCYKADHTHGSIIFNAFIFCQFFNEYTSRKLWNEFNIFSGIEKNKMFAIVSIITFGLQIFLIEVGGDFVKTSPLTLIQWLITIALGFIGVPIGMLMRLIPINEDPNSFFTSAIIGNGIEDKETKGSDTNSDDNNSPLDDLEDDIKNEYVDVEMDLI